VAHAPEPSACPAHRAHRRTERRRPDGIGGPLTPFEDWTTYNAQEEQAREAVNQWIRTSHAYEDVVDFDAVVRDPADPHRMLPAFDSGDHLHPNDAGYRAMGDAVPLAELGTRAAPR
jgi:lysophospholipase L1-like esterase